MADDEAEGPSTGPHALMAGAEAEDASRQLLDIAERLERLAAKVDMISSAKVARMAHDCRVIASQKRPKPVFARVPFPGDVVF